MDPLRDLRLDDWPNAGGGGWRDACEDEIVGGRWPTSDGWADVLELDEREREEEGIGGGGSTAG